MSDGGTGIEPVGMGDTGWDVSPPAVIRSQWFGLALVRKNVMIHSGMNEMKIDRHLKGANDLPHITEKLSISHPCSLPGKR